MKTYQLEYDYTTLATVEIDEVKATGPIKEMVEFWLGWEDAVSNNNGDYTRTWLKNLAKFIIRNQELPLNNEGWTLLDGTYGITVKSWEVWRPDDDDISIE